MVSCPHGESRAEAGAVAKRPLAVPTQGYQSWPDVLDYDVDRCRRIARSVLGNYVKDVWPVSNAGAVPCSCVGVSETGDPIATPST
jgi:hypothetical protein